MAAFGADVAAVVERLDLDDVVLIGHSMGGPVVVEAARLLGDRVIGVVGVDTFTDVSQRYTQEEIEGFLQPFRDDFAEATRGLVRGAMFAPNTDSALVDQIVADMSSAPPDVGVGALVGYLDWYHEESETAFRELNTPVYLINSDMNPTNVDAGREYISSFEVVLMSGVGHFVMMEDPDTFNRLLDEIVEGLQDD
jgi:pimeloyl-ACP methyl ester carboxylesterase